MPTKKPATRPAKKKPTTSQKRKPAPSAPSKLPDVLKPQGPARLGRKTIKLTAIELYRTCWKTRVDAAKDLAVETIKVGNVAKSDVLPPNTPFYRMHVYNKDKKHSHVVTVFVPDGLPFKSKSKVIVDCGCMDQAYRFEYALAKRTGNAFIWRCNGEPPVVTNPGKVPGICKHIRLGLNYMLRRAKEGTLSKLDNSKSRARVSLKG